MNLKYYNLFKDVPEEAKKPISGGRLKGKTDINPMWRIKKLTEVFGPCGLGWYTEIKNKWLDNANNEITAHVQIHLFVKYDDGWSAPIEGIGGSKLLVKETSGLTVDDDAYKKAYTDAISVACKALGVGASVYFEGDTGSKYDSASTQDNIQENTKSKKADKQDEFQKLRETRLTEIKAVMKEKGLDRDDLKVVQETYGIDKIEFTPPVIYAKFVEALRAYGDA